MIDKLQTAVEIAEEVEVQLVPLMCGIDSGNTVDAYLMCRGIYRQCKVLAEKLREAAEEYNHEKQTS